MGLCRFSCRWGFYGAADGAANGAADETADELVRYLAPPLSGNMKLTLPMELAVSVGSI
jgi:hypothetical protein